MSKIPLDGAFLSFTKIAVKGAFEKWGAFKSGARKRSKKLKQKQPLLSRGGGSQHRISEKNTAQAESHKTPNAVEGSSKESCSERGGKDLFF